MNKKYYRLLFLIFFSSSPIVTATIDTERDALEEFTSEDKKKEAQIYFSQIYFSQISEGKNDSLILAGSEALLAYQNFNLNYPRIKYSEERRNYFDMMNKEDEIPGSFDLTKYEKFLDDINYQELVENDNELSNLGKQLNEKRDKFSLELEKSYFEIKEIIKNLSYYINVEKYSKPGLVCKFQGEDLLSLKNFLEKVRHLKNLPKGEIDVFPTLQASLYLETDDSYISKYCTNNDRIHDAYNWLVKEDFFNNMTVDEAYNLSVKILYNYCVWNAISYIIEDVNCFDGFTEKEFEKYVINKMNFFINEDKKKHGTIWSNENKASNSISTKNNKNSNTNLYIIGGVILSAIVVGGLIYYWKNQHTNID